MNVFKLIHSFPGNFCTIELNIYCCEISSNKGNDVSITSASNDFFTPVNCSFFLVTNLKPIQSYDTKFKNAWIGLKAGKIKFMIVFGGSRKSLNLIRLKLAVLYLGRALACLLCCWEHFLFRSKHFNACSALWISTAPSTKILFHRK